MNKVCETPECQNMAVWVWLTKETKASLFEETGGLCFQCNECGGPTMLDDTGEVVYAARPLGNNEYMTADGWFIVPITQVVG